MHAQGEPRVATDRFGRNVGLGSEGTWEDAVVGGMPLQRDVAIMDEPEHLTWFEGTSSGPASPPSAPFPDQEGG